METIAEWTQKGRLLQRCSGHLILQQKMGCGRKSYRGQVLQKACIREAGGEQWHDLVLGKHSSQESRNQCVLGKSVTKYRIGPQPSYRIQQKDSSARRADGNRQSRCQRDWGAKQMTKAEAQEQRSASRNQAQSRTCISGMQCINLTIKYRPEYST